MNHECVIHHIRFCALMVIMAAIPVFGDVTYWLDSSAAGNAEVVASIEEAVPIYNKYGSFNKHLSIYYNEGIPTAEANYTGYIGFGSQRTVRTALHEMGHTVGMGTYTGSPSYASLIVGGVWQGFYGRKRAIEMASPYADGLHGDVDHAIWPWGMNYESEDSSFTERIKHVRIMAAMRCDMGIMSYSKEAEHQIVPLGETAIFSVSSPLASSYQWYKDGILLNDGGDISGVTRSTLTIANVETADAGNYFCLAAGAGETLTSRSRRLVIQGQVGQWDFENNPNDSIGSYDGTPVGAPVYTTGLLGQAIHLDGIDDFITLPEGIADAEDITITAWIRWNGGNQWQRIFDFGTSTSQYLFLTPRSGSNTLRFGIKNGSTEQTVETSQLATGQWVHVAVTLRRDAATLYVNGQAVAANGNVAIDPIDLLADRNYIGASQWPDPLFNGDIDDFRIYNYALSGSEIWALWGQSANNPPVFDDDTLILPDGYENVSYSGVNLSDHVSEPDGDAYTCIKVSGPAWLNVAADGTLSGTPSTNDRSENVFVVRVTDAYGATDDAIVKLTVYGSADIYYQFENNTNDSVGSNHGTPTGTPVYTTGISGFGQAIDLDGVDDYITLPAGIADTENITIAAWVYWNGGSDWQRLFDFGNDTTQYMFLTPKTGGVMRFAITGSGSGAGEERLETDVLPSGQWTHIAVTLSENTGKLYVNGQLKDINTAMTINPSDINPAVNYIGKSQWSDPLFDGQIDDFRIYRYALSADEIGALNLQPFFTSDPIVNLNGIEMSDYSGTNLTAFVNAPQGMGGLSFSKVVGPDWLTVAADGTLSGLPVNSNIGENVFTVRLSDATGQSDTTSMVIDVENVYSGVLGTDDLLGFAGQWLAQDCGICNGADLDGDHDVTASDFYWLARHWLLSEDLQLYLKFDEMTGSIANDASLYGRFAGLINNPVWTTGNTGGGLSFDGSNYVEVADDFGLNPNAGDFSVAFRMKSDTPSQNAFIVSKRKQDDPYTQYLIGLSAGNSSTWSPAGSKLTFVFRQDASRQRGGYTTADVDFSDWTHICVVFDRSANPPVRVHINGASTSVTHDNTSGLPSMINTSTPLYLGRHPSFSSLAYQGLLDDIQIYNRVLTDQEILNLSQ